MKKVCFLFISALVYITAFTQNIPDSADRRFHDDLLDHLVGEWSVTSTAHGTPFTADLSATWVLNHQYLFIHFKSHEIIPWWNMPMEYFEYIGYNRYQKRYTVHGMSIEGDEDLSEGFSYGYRTGNEFKNVAKFSSDTSVVQIFTWHPETKTWNIQSRSEIGGKEGEVFLNMKLVSLKPSTKRTKVSLK